MISSPLFSPGDLVHAKIRVVAYVDQVDARDALDIDEADVAGTLDFFERSGPFILLSDSVTCLVLQVDAFWILLLARMGTEAKVCWVHVKFLAFVSASSVPSSTSLW